MRIHLDIAIILVIACTILVFWPAFQSWFDSDEIFQLLSLNQDQGLSSTFDLWHFDAGEGKMRFFRPLSSITILLDGLAFGASARAYHNHNFLWYLLLCFMIYRLLLSLRDGEFGGGPWIAFGAAFIFAIDATHAENVARIACRHFTIAAVFGIAGLLCHIRWSRTHDVRQLLFSLLALTAALLSSEAALQVAGYLVAYELMRSDDTLRRRALRLLPTILLVAAYLVFYVSSGYGAHGNGYLDVFAAPKAVVMELPGRFSRLWVETVLCPPSILGWHQSPYRLIGTPGVDNWDSEISVAVQLALIVGATALFAFLAASVPRRLRWLALGTLLSLSPATLGQPGPRLVFVPSIGVAALIACFLVLACDSGQRWRFRWLVMPLASLLAAQRLLMCPIMLNAQLTAQKEVTMQFRVEMYSHWP